MNEDEGRRRLALAVKADRGRIYRTVDKARIAADISRGAWEKVEAGAKVRGFTLAAVEEALAWPAGRAARIIAGADVESPPSPGDRADDVPGLLEVLRYVLELIAAERREEAVSRAMAAMVPFVEGGLTPIHDDLTVSEQRRARDVATWARDAVQPKPPPAVPDDEPAESDTA